MPPPTLAQITAALDRLAYKIFTEGDYNLNLVGVRSGYRASNRFDDWLAAFFRVKGQWVFYTWPATTNPGWAYLESPPPQGTAILKEGQYRGAWQIGLHRGQYPALVQTRPVTVWRDANRDHLLDTLKTETGLFGINIHRASAQGTSTLVNNWSAGCQVLASLGDFNTLMGLAGRAAKIYGPALTYTLINQEALQ